MKPEPPGPDVVQKHRRLGRASILVAVIAAAVFANSLPNGFAYDDLHQLVDHERIHTLTGTLSALDEPYWPGGEVGKLLGLWRPVTTLAYGVGWWAFGGQPFGFHLANLLLHALLSVMVLRFCARLVSARAAVAAALVFAVHPVHTEAVANSVGVAELISSALVLWAVLLFLRWRAGGTDQAQTDGQIVSLGGVRIGLLCALFFVALLTKEGAIVLPALFVILDWGMSEARMADLVPYFRERFALYAGLTATAAVMFVMRWRVLGSFAAPEPPTGAEALAVIPTIWTAAEVWPHYLRLLFFPLHLSADYAPGVIPVRYGWGLENSLGVFVVMAVLGLAWAAWTRRARGGGGDGVLAIGVLWFVFTILPVSNLFFVSGILLAERTLYLPSVGFVLAVGWAVDRVWSPVADPRPQSSPPASPEPGNGSASRSRREQRALAGAFVLVLVLLAARTIQRNPVWKDNNTLFTGLMMDHPESGRSQWVVANAFLTVGDVESSVRAFQRAKGIFGWPGNFVLEAEAGERLMEADRPLEAIPFLRDAIRLDSLHPDPRRLLALAHQNLGNWVEAERAAASALAVGGEDPGMHHLRAGALEILGRPEDAIVHRLRVIELADSAGWLPWVWLSTAQRDAGRGSAACASLDSARTRVPGESERSTVDSLRALVPGCS